MHKIGDRVLASDFGEAKIIKIYKNESKDDYMPVYKIQSLEDKRQFKFVYALDICSFETISIKKASNENLHN